MPCAARSFRQIAGCATGSVGRIAAQPVHAEGSATAPRDSRFATPIQTPRPIKLAPMINRFAACGYAAKIAPQIKNIMLPAFAPAQLIFYV
jgi:hypothetical protein